MSTLSNKKEVIQADNEIDKQSLDNGALESSFQFSAAAEKKLVRKIDLMILPIMVFAYMLAFLDKQALGYTALMGIREDLHLVGSQYNWSSSIFYFGYLFFSYPASLLMVKFPLGKYLATSFMLWAIVLACHAACTNFKGIMIARFFLGCTEASLSPGFTLITSLWYRTSEQPLRHGIWFCGNSISLIFGNLIAVGILQIKSALEAWQWLFIIFGLVTFLWGVVMLFRLPDSPTTASFLTDEEKLIAVERLKANQTGYKTTNIDGSQMWEAFIDPKTWLLAVLILASNIPNGGFTTFNGLVLKGFGFSTFHTLLLGIPGGVIVFIFVLSSGIISSKVPKTRCLVMVGCNIISIIGSALVYATTPVGSRYAGLLLMGIYSAAMPVSMAMISSNIAGFTKKATVSAIYFIMYCTGNIVGPQLFFEKEAPKYQSGFLAIIICLVICVLDCLLLLFHLRWTNSQRDKKLVVEVESQPHEKNAQPGAQLLDTTDLKNQSFRYVY
ncbi:hypothetical protein N7499_008505 [Penicillium canescens]|uniref:Major facilitator superfamily (MFS) profile domain-containing protein n=1 Tax=Penicillium canescens TaxID=5083 RepID=A0AAD6HZD4_PENCN|nr:uncharacterized protein N7446_013540 [Penicillium canescens]KAJ5985217.1 hypothetical protein N7522_012413 [Penicillium canescens]KAJ6023181.1 hypothetical protein N7460_013576 [Penicillium canescens]KAJ6025551.1 hypothetical protein N7444_013230 [Penicillium canescens]KAJ6042474.1 hypothetical protein N7446_013540 [Penicillium canescens]KAJ6076524.1 hypothetical protein N7499_008505 [Penicillium canescens]